MLAKSVPREKLLVYLVISEAVISSVPIKELVGVQLLVYYVSKRLLDAETRYPELESLALAPTVMSHKLCHYFLANLIVVLTNFLLK